MGQWFLLFTVLVACLPSRVTAGYTKETLGSLVYLIKDTFPQNYQNLRLIEFGNQETHDKKSMNYPIYLDEQFSTYTVATKYFFQHMGISYDSVDLNGYDGALKLDCRQDISKELEPGDILTNIGFSEHVGEGDLIENVMLNQYRFFKNMHDLARGK